MAGKQLVMYWPRSTGSGGWQQGVVEAYDQSTNKHTINWVDGDTPWVVDLMHCTKCKEWRLIQEGEDVEEFLR